MQGLLSILLVLFVTPVLQAETPPSAQELEEWFMSDELTPPSQSSDSQLKFIPAPTDNAVLHSVNAIKIRPQSLTTGWVELVQCYQHLDAVPEMEVVYQYKNMRNLMIIKKQNIAQAYIQGQSVQLEDVARNARLCVQSEVKILHKNKNATYTLLNGPFHRQFMDSYFPFHLTLKISFPSALLKFIKSKPAAQTGFEVTLSDNTLLIESYFTGKLYTKVTFKSR